MPVFEPSTDISQKQEQLAAILVPVLVMLGGMGLSYGIYTALRWFSSSNRQGFRNRTESIPDPEAIARTNDPEKLATVQSDALNSSSTTTSAPPPLRLIHPTQLPVIGRDAILARKSQKNINTAQFGKDISANSGMALAQQRDAQPAQGKENRNPHVPKRPSPLQNGYKPDVPERAVHALHRYHYF